jgi:hypothetical protein
MFLSHTLSLDLRLTLSRDNDSKVLRFQTPVIETGDEPEPPYKPAVMPEQTEPAALPSVKDLASSGRCLSAPNVFLQSFAILLHINPLFVLSSSAINL